MPPVAKILGIVVVLLAGPAWLAAQTPASSSKPAVSRNTSPPTSANSWVTPLGREARPAGPLAAGGVQSAMYDAPAPASPPPATALPVEHAQTRNATNSAAPTLLPEAGTTSSATLLPRKSAEGRTPRSPSIGYTELLTTASSLAVVLGLFLVFAWFVRRAGPKGSTVLPGDVLEVLGRAPLALRQQVYLIRCGRKLILVHACPDNVETLTEITEPEEVDRLLGLCRQSQPNSATAAFRQVFQQFAGEPTVPGFLGNTDYDEVRLANTGNSRRASGSQEDDDA